MRFPFIVIALSIAANLQLSPNTPAANPAKPAKAWVYFGTYTDGKSKGIYLYELNTETGAMTSKGLVAEAVNPSFVAIHPNRKFLYAVSEVADTGGKKTGAVAAFAIDGETGNLKELNRKES